MYVCISTDCTMQFYACVCISTTLVQYNPMLAYVCRSRFAQCLRNSVAKMNPWGRLRPGLLPGLCGPCLMEEHDHKRFKSQPCSLRIVYDFSDTLKIQLMSGGCALFNCYSPRQVTHHLRLQHHLLQGGSHSVEAKLGQLLTRSWK